MNHSLQSPFIAHEPLDPEFHRNVITRRDLPAELLKRIEANEYCLLLGPRYSGRTTTLHLVRQELIHQKNRVPVYIDPRELDLTDEAGFLQSLADCIGLEIERFGCSEPLRRSYQIECDAIEAFTHFLRELTRSGLRPVVLFDAVEAVPPNVLITLLNVADALFTTRNDPDRRYQRNLVFVFAGNIPLSYRTTYPNPVSPFNICSTLVARDLTSKEALRFLEEVNREYGLRFRFEALQAMVEYAGGDLNTLQRLGARTVEIAEGREIGRESVEAAVSHLLDDAERGEDDTLRQMVVEIEDDSETFNLMVEMLRGGSRAFEPSRFNNEVLHASSLTYPEMTGALTLMRRGGEPVEWLFRNLFIRKFLHAHFSPARVVRAYTALGMFDHAIEQCTPLLGEIRKKFVQPIGSIDDQHLNDVIIAMTNRIYAAGSHEVAYELIALLLNEAFGCEKIVYYDYRSESDSLHAVSFLSNLFRNDGSVVPVRSPDHRETLEVRAYHSRVFAVAHRAGSGLRVAIPMTNLAGEVTAVIGLTPPIDNERAMHLTARMHVVQRALRSVNFALNRVERFNKDRIQESASHLAPAEQKRSNVFVAHKFTRGLLENLQDQLGQAQSAFSFLFPATMESVGLLHTVIREELDRAQLGLFEMSHLNNNVYYELGYSIGINLPGVMFLHSTPGRREMLPPLLEGILYLAYSDYSGLVEGVVRRLEEVLRRSVNRGDHYLHFLQCDIPSSARRRTHYAAVLEHNYFGDARDYRRSVEAGLGSHGLTAAFVLDDETDPRNFVQGHAWGKRLLDLYVLIKHSDVVICRCEEVPDSIEASQAFLALGIADGLNRPVLRTRLEIDRSGTKLGIPKDLEGLSMLHYVRLADVEQQITRATISKSRRAR